MTWLQVLQLVTVILSQALAAFAQGQKKEEPHAIVLSSHQQEVVKSLLPERS